MNEQKKEINPPSAPSVFVGLEREIAEVQRFYVEAGRRFTARFLDLARGASENLKPELRWERLKIEAGSFTADLAQQMEMEAIVELEQEYVNLLHAIEWAHNCQEWTSVCQISDELAVFANIRSYWSDWTRIAELAAADAVHAADPRLEAEALNNLSVVYRQLERLSDATECSRRSLTLCQERGYRYGEGLVLGNLGGIHFARDKFEESTRCYEAALQIFKELDDRYGQAQSLMGIGIALARQNRLDEAHSRLEECLSIQREMADHFGEAQTLNNLGIIQRMMGRLFEAIATFQTSLSIKRELGDQQGIANVLNNLAVAYLQLKEFDHAIQTWEEALALLSELHPPEAERVARRLARAREMKKAKPTVSSEMS